MAKIKRLPSLNIIRGFKGTIDYYVYMGQPCARAWPKSPGKRRAASVMAQWPVFTAAASLWKQLSPEVKQVYHDFAVSTNLTGRDWFTRGYISGIYQKPPP